jgi:4-amino-4-deoxy-L-arabinose transferase-like glycosyltransferase
LWSRALVVTLAAGAIRLILGATIPLFPDETYYWDWSRQLAAGYFDHPPLIAWLIRGGTALFGDTSVGVRFFSIVAGTIAALFVCASARRVAGERAAVVAALVFALMPLSATGLVLATPDAPLLASAAATIYAVIRAIEQPPHTKSSLQWWCLAGVALGLAFCSKYTAALLPLGVLAAIATRQQLRARLAEPGPYVAIAIALLIFTPVIAWNARHGWVSFTFQLQHGLGGVSGSVLKRELDLLGGQLGLVSPILFVVMVIAVVHAYRDKTAASTLLAPSATVIFAFFLYAATRRRVEANWPALAYVPAAILVAAHARGVSWDRLLRSGILVAGALTVVAYTHSLLGILPLPARRDPVARGHGWEDLARAVNRVYAPKLPISSYRTHVGADRYQEASELAYHLVNKPQAFALNLTSRANQYDLWPGFPEHAYPRDGLILVVDDVASEHPTVAMLRPHFERVTKGDQVILARKGDPVKALRIWILDRWLGTWPSRPLRSRA